MKLKTFLLRRYKRTCRKTLAQRIQEYELDLEKGRYIEYGKYEKNFLTHLTLGMVLEKLMRNNYLFIVQCKKRNI